MANTLQDILAWMQSPERSQQIQGIGGMMGRSLENLQASRAENERLWGQAFQDPNDPLKVTNPEALHQLGERTMSGAMGFAPVGMIGTRFKGSGAVPTEVPGFGPAKEIQDVGSSINVEKLATALANKKDQPMTLGDILNHPELYRDYPELAKYPVQGLGTMQAILDALKGSGLKGIYADKQFYFPTKSKEGIEASLADIHSTLLHETQHAIQELDKMPQGGMTEQFLSKGFEKAQNKVGTIKKAANEELANRIADKKLEPGTIYDIMFNNSAGKELIKNDKTIGPSALFYQKVLKAESNLQKKYDEAYQKYRRLGGEAQARAVQKRFENPEQYNTPVSESYDVPINSLHYKDPTGFSIK